MMNNNNNSNQQHTKNDIGNNMITMNNPQTNFAQMSSQQITQLQLQNNIQMNQNFI